MHSFYQIILKNGLITSIHYQGLAKLYIFSYTKILSEAIKNLETSRSIFMPSEEIICVERHSVQLTLISLNQADIFCVLYYTHIWYNDRCLICIICCYYFYFNYTFLTNYKIHAFSTFVSLFLLTQCIHVEYNTVPIWFEFLSENIHLSSP